jgi:hypothetical protein
VSRKGNGGDRSLIDERTRCVSLVWKSVMSPFSLPKIVRLDSENAIPWASREELRQMKVSLGSLWKRCCYPSPYLLVLSGGVASCVILVLIMQQMFGCRDRPQSPSPMAKAKTVDSKSLINALVNHNPVPSVAEWPSREPPSFAEKFDWPEYFRARRAIQPVVAHAEEIWHELLEHCDDGRYCTTVHNDIGRNYSVGQVSELIVRGWLTEGYIRHFPRLCEAVPYPESMKLYYKLQCPDMITRRKNMTDWCRRHGDKPLYELQIEMCNWAVARVASLKDISDRQREPFIRAVREQIQTLSKSKKAIPFPGFDKNEDFLAYGHDRGRKGGGRKGDKSNF